MTIDDKKEIALIVEAAIMKVNGSPKKPRLFLTPEDVAKALKISTPLVRQMCERGEIRAFRVGKFYRIEQKDLDFYLKSCDLAA